MSETATLPDVHDASTRPHAPALNPTPEQRRHGQRLAMFHRFHLSEMGRVARALALVEQGLAAPGAVGEALESLTLTENMRRCGTLCGQECQMLTVHHTIEDRAIFPVLRADTRLRAVIDRLAAEHLVIHDLLDELQGKAAALAVDPSREIFAAAKETFARLDAFVRSHFGYEETEISDALGVLGVEL